MDGQILGGIAASGAKSEIDEAVAQAGLDDRIEIRKQDFAELDDVESARAAYGRALTVLRECHDRPTEALVLGALAAVMVGSELWRRAVLKYVREPRHRNQLLLLRRIITWMLILLILSLTFITRLSSFATFAGLLTAGLAVAMQSVLVSLVGYFILIGKYGLRVGDRVCALLG